MTARLAACRQRDGQSDGAPAGAGRAGPRGLGALELANQEAGAALLEDLARQLAFVEALRARLLRRVQAMALRVERMVRAGRGERGRWRR
ncbi:MAG TPA: hypothetical protein VK726_22695 [Acetobacteraceae bacterium]|nr:hypothetical protein [Acetobacteraceae bacterium]